MVVMDWLLSKSFTLSRTQRGKPVVAVPDAVCSLGGGSALFVFLADHRIFSQLKARSAFNLRGRSR